MDFRKVILTGLSKFNFIGQYIEYRKKLKELSNTNTLNVSEFMSMDSDKRDMVLFSLVAALKIEMTHQSKLLYAILVTLLGGTSALTYIGVT